VLLTRRALLDQILLARCAGSFSVGAKLARLPTGQAPSAAPAVPTTYTIGSSGSFTSPTALPSAAMRTAQGLLSPSRGPFKEPAVHYPAWPNNEV
jgi:hypothetical protein